jgi:hypothetical protein
MFLRNVGIYLRAYTASQPRTTTSSKLLLSLIITSKFSRYVDSRHYTYPQTSQKMGVNSHIQDSAASCSHQRLGEAKKRSWRASESPFRGLHIAPVIGQSLCRMIYQVEFLSLINYSLSHFNSKDGDSMFLRNVGVYQQVHTALQPRRPTLICSPVWQPQISQVLIFCFNSKLWVYFRTYYVLNPPKSQVKIDQEI